MIRTKSIFLKKVNLGIKSICNDYFFHKICFLMLALTLNPSCSTKLEENNNIFLKKYGSEVGRINNARKRTSKDVFSAHVDKKRQNPAWKNPAMLFGIDGSDSLRSAFIDTNKLRKKEKPQEFLPNLGTMIRGKQNLVRSPEIADVTYRMDNYPKTYKRRLVSFDNIKIPEHDYFGVDSSLGTKPYDMVEHNVLQENIDGINKYFDAQNNKINLILLEDKEQIRRIKMSKLLDGDEFGNELRAKAALAQKKFDELEAEADLKKKQEEAAKESVPIKTEEDVKAEPVKKNKKIISLIDII
jgi:hypothetical protein